ncbi:basic leucine zipper 34-like [Pistacia vera]|uniref:basic leucine zipper 34-like n=1 Tax=Pistacia vera TaxID=55513 RepID=UPI001262FA1F|nr:basic leucine zipper 34-like [Pistacia vera]
MEGAYKRGVHGLPPLPISLSISGNNGGANREITSSENLSTTLAADLQDKKQKRILASRQYSQKYRLKQLHYILQLETEVKALQAEVVITSPRIKYFRRQNSLLRAENVFMKEKLNAISNECTFKEAQYEELKGESEIFKQLFKQQEEAAGLVKAKPADQNCTLEFNLFQEPHSSMSPQMFNQNMNPFAPGQI